MPRNVIGVACVAFVALLSSCSSNSGAASSAGSSAQSSAAPSSADVCASAAHLRASLTALGDVQVLKEGTDAVQKEWTTVQADWAQLSKDVRDHYGEQVDRVQAEAGSVQSAVTTAQEGATAQTLAGVATAVGTFLHDAGVLVNEVSSTC